MKILKIGQLRLIKEKKKSNIKSIFDKFSDLLNIKNINNERFFNEGDVKEIELEIIGEKSEHEREMEIYHHEFLKRTYSPEFLVSNYFSQELDYIQFAKNGITSALFNLKENLNKNELKDFLDNLNRNFKNKNYSCLKNNEGKNIIIEKIIFEYFEIYQSRKYIDHLIKEKTKEVF